MRFILFLAVICFLSPTSYADYSSDKKDCLEFKEAARILAEHREKGVPYQSVIGAILKTARSSKWTADDVAMAVYLAHYVYTNELKQSEVGVVFQDCMKARGHVDS